MTSQHSQNTTLQSTGQETIGAFVPAKGVSRSGKIDTLFRYVLSHRRRVAARASYKTMMQSGFCFAHGDWRITAHPDQGGGRVSIYASQSLGLDYSTLEASMTVTGRDTFVPEMASYEQITNCKKVGWFRITSDRQYDWAGPDKPERVTQIIAEAFGW